MMAGPCTSSKHEGPHEQRQGGLYCRLVPLLMDLLLPLQSKLKVKPSEGLLLMLRTGSILKKPAFSPSLPASCQLVADGHDG